MGLARQVIRLVEAGEIIPQKVNNYTLELIKEHAGLVCSFLRFTNTPRYCQLGRLFNLLT